jgi:hypothetical protein
VILIVASELDAVARDAASSWPGDDAVVLTPRDLCTRGWRIDLGAFEESQIVASGNIYPVRDVAGVITLLPYVMDYELFTIEELERKYVASEIAAFLFYFLSKLECPVLNRPTAHCLAGPSWRPEQWNEVCRQAGLPTRPPRHLHDSQSPAPELTNISTWVSVVGSECVGEAEPKTRLSAVKLARLARVEFLTVRLQGNAEDKSVHSIELVPDLGNPAIVKAVQNHLLS